jgi:hypothetical protein
MLLGIGGTTNQTEMLMNVCGYLRNTQRQTWCYCEAFMCGACPICGLVKYLLATVCAYLQCIVPACHNLSPLFGHPVR